jgi:hypothetical protein
MDKVKKILKSLPMLDAIKKAKELGVYKGVSSDCMDGTHIVIGEASYVWDGRMRTILDENNYVWFNGYLGIPERELLL